MKKGCLFGDARYGTSSRNDFDVLGRSSWLEEFPSCNLAGEVAGRAVVLDSQNWKVYGQSAVNQVGV